MRGVFEYMNSSFLILLFIYKQVDINTTQQFYTIRRHLNNKYRTEKDHRMNETTDT